MRPRQTEGAARHIHTLARLCRRDSGCVEDEGIGERSFFLNLFSCVLKNDLGIVRMVPRGTPHICALSIDSSIDAAQQHMRVFIITRIEAEGHQRVGISL